MRAGNCTIRKLTREEGGNQSMSNSERKLYSFGGMPAVIESAAMQKVMRLVERIARSAASVLITGESGSGKELVARALHEYSPRKQKPWVDINCAALPDHLLESELFGYEKGAFSGAETAKPGMFELADEGTLFLDEIGELDLNQQVKLLRVLDGWPHYRLGGIRKIHVNVRIVAATNSDLESAVSSGRFRADLYHRLNQVRVAVPPLRERPEDIAPLARLFLAQHNPEFTLAAEALAALKDYGWPGNVREIRNVMARVAMTAMGTEIGPEDLPPELQLRKQSAVADADYSLERLEQEVIFHALANAAGRRDRAAAMLGISRRTLTRRLKVYGGKALDELCGTVLPCN
jgi:transcriptional regulator with PAS, ATPase and Fis domain